MTALLEPKLVRTFDTFTIETGVNLRTRFIYLAEGTWRPETSFYHNIMAPLRDIDGLKKPSVNDAGIVRYTIERSPKIDEERIHAEVRAVIVAALAKFSRASQPVQDKKAA